MKQTWVAIGMALFGLGTAHAASTSYLLDQSDGLPDGSSYLRVTLTEVDDGVHFRVETLASLNDIASMNFGVHTFGFNLATDTAYDISALPADWSTRTEREIGGFGIFDVLVKSTDTTQTGDLRFHVGGTTLADFGDSFAALVDGLQFESDMKRFGSANFGNFVATGAVPIPPAVWLLGSGLVGMVSVARRKA